jgi:hypothetical protein
MTEYKTVGEAAVAINKGDRQEVGETLEGMQKSYAREMELTLKRCKDIWHYYIVVFRKKEFLSPTDPVQNVVRQRFVAPWPKRPRAALLKKEAPMQIFVSGLYSHEPDFNPPRLSKL